MKGKPKYNYGDIVNFVLEDQTLTGEVYIVDKWGTWDDDTDASYDIFVSSKNCLYKHISERFVTKPDDTSNKPNTEVNA